jgi:hypothetical protein
MFNGKARWERFGSVESRLPGPHQGIVGVVVLGCALIGGVHSNSNGVLQAADPVNAVDKAASKNSVDDGAFSQRVRPILQKYCFECHGDKKAKADLRLDTLATDFSTAKTAATWKEVEDRVTGRASPAMPPKQKPRPSPEEVQVLREWIGARSAEFTANDAAKQKAEGRAQIRRLNRVEYDNTLRDLLGIAVDLKHLLPEDDAVAGFDNVGSGLPITPIHLESYLEAAETALSTIIDHGPRPKKSRVKLTYKDQPTVGARKLLQDETVVFFSSAAATLSKFRPAFTGLYRIRISAFAHQNKGKPQAMLVSAGGSTRQEGYFGVAADKPTVIEFVARMGPRDTLWISPCGLGLYYIKNPASHPGPGLAVEWVDVEGPLEDMWPPESYQRLLGQLDLKKATLSDAEKVVRAFVPRAFRRPVSEEKVQKYVSFLRARMKSDKSSIDEALRQTLKAVLCAPDFLLLHETPGPLDDFALAARLSYFFWRSMPDSQLLELARRKQLRAPGELRRQVERLLQDPKSAALTEHFLGQWLDLRRIDATVPDRKLYPEFDSYLKHSMLKEPQLFFEEMLKNDHNLLSFIDSDFSLLNDRLAQHYGIAGVEGVDFRKVKLPPGSHRGGVLTMAAVLKVTANGTVTSPVLRGTWVLRNILGQPLQLPSGLMVPAVEPDIRGALHIRDQLAKHRTLAQCASCHQKIDPLGFALESFDPIGGYRTDYRSLGGRVRANIKINGQPVEYGKGLPVQVGDVMADGKRFKDSDEFKKILLSRPDPIIHTITEKLLVCATGSPVRLADRAALTSIVQRVREKNHGLRTLVQEIVQSELFLNK